MSRSIAVLSAALALTLGSRARAGDFPTDVKTDAMQLARNGAVDYRAGRYAEARAKFEAAYQEYPTAVLTLDLARVEIKLGRCSKAMQYARTYGAAFGGEARASAVTPQALLAAVEEKCPELWVTSDPSGATILIDSTPQTPQPKTPWRGRLPVGKHQILARKGGFPIMRESVTLEVGRVGELHVNFFERRISQSGGPAAALPPIGDLPLALSAVAPLADDLPLTDLPTVVVVRKPSPSPAPVASPAPAPPPVAVEHPAPPPVALMPAAATPPDHAEVPIAATAPAHRVHKAPWAVGWAAICVGAVVAAVGVGVGITGYEHQQSVHTTAQSDARSLLNAGNSEAIGADVLFAAGGVLGAVGTGLVVTF